MGTTLFNLNITGRSLAPLTKKTLAELGLTEPGDLETWLASANESLFGRRVIWISRQDRASEEQRSDLLGIDEEGDLLVTELKRGELDEAAVTQALSYAAEYAEKSADDLALLYANQCAKQSKSQLIEKEKVGSKDEAQAKISKFVGPGTEVNESQIILLVAEDFSPKALAICDYLNESSGEATFSLECWKYTIYSSGNNVDHFLLEQILPPPSVRQAIEEKREASKSRKYARDPQKKDFIDALMAFLRSKGLDVSRKRGASYECTIKDNSSTGTGELIFGVHEDHPILILKTGVTFQGDQAQFRMQTKSTQNGELCVEFNGVDCSNLVFTQDFGDNLLKVRGAIKPAASSTAASPQ